MNTAAIVLAAGRGTRMGQPKVLLSVRGEPLVAQHVRRLRELGCARVVLVVPLSLAAEVSALVQEPAALVVGVETDSQSESLQRGLRALGESLAGDDRLLVTPIDLVPPRLDTLRSLCSTLDAGASVVVPRCAGSNGHPLLLHRHVLDPYLRFAPWELPPLNGFVASLRVCVDVDDAAVLGDLDDAADLVRVASL